MAIAFIIDNELFELLYASAGKTTEGRNTEKNQGFDNLKEGNTIYEQFVYVQQHFSRGDILSFIETYLKTRELPRPDGDRVSVFPRLLFPIRIGEAPGNLYDYSDQGSSFIFKKSQVKSDFQMERNTTIDISFSGVSLSFFITRIERDITVRGEQCFKIAGYFLKPGVDKL